METQPKETSHLQLLAEIDEAVTSIYFERSTPQSDITSKIKGVLRTIGCAHQYRVRESRKVGDPGTPEMLWDMVWLAEDNEERILDFPLACEIELDPKQSKVWEDLRKLFLANAAIKVLICRTEASFDIADELDRCPLVRKGDLWYVAHFGSSDHIKWSRDYFFEWESHAFSYPYRSSGKARDVIRAQNGAHWVCDYWNHRKLPEWVINDREYFFPAHSVYR